MNTEAKMTDSELLKKVWEEVSGNLGLIIGALTIDAMHSEHAKTAHQAALELANWLDDELNKHFYEE